MHGGLSPELHHMDQIRRIARPTDVPGALHYRHLMYIHRERFIEIVMECAIDQRTPILCTYIHTYIHTYAADTGLLCDLLWADPDKEIIGCVLASDSIPTLPPIYPT